MMGVRGTGEHAVQEQQQVMVDIVAVGVSQPSAEALPPVDESSAPVGDVTGDVGQDHATGGQDAEGGLLDEEASRTGAPQMKTVLDCRHCDEQNDVSCGVGVAGA